MSLSARRELLAATATRYQQARKKEKQNILDEFIAATGYHRKYAIGLLNDFGPVPTELSKRERIPRDRIYDDDVKEALIFVWETANRICSKRLVPFLPKLVKSLERHGHLALTGDVRERLLAISARTVDRLLYDMRHGEQTSGLSTTKPGGLLKHMIPIRTFSDWDDDRPGFIEADLVAHCGDDPGGHFLYTLTMTDVATGWIELAALLFRDQETTLNAIKRLQGQLPFDLLGLDTDNGSEFINYLLFYYCDDKEITFTRSRPYKKNDQCHVEEKNGSVVRKFVGYDRFEGIEPCRVLGALYERLRLYVNFFQPSVKLISKQRVGSRVVKKYAAAKTPHQRVVAYETLSDESEQALAEQFKTLDPIALLAEIEHLQDQLWPYAYVGRQVVTSTLALNGLHPETSTEQSDQQREPVEPETPGPATPSGNPDKSSGTQNGSDLADTSDHQPLERSKRRYRRNKPKGKHQAPRWWRTHPDAFADVWEVVEQQLERTPDIQAKALFHWLQEQYPGLFKDAQLRTFQRRVKTWRVDQAGRQLEAEDENRTASWLSGTEQ
jgi:hypothetical protein